jgi:hypothetical protein
MTNTAQRRDLGQRQTTEVFQVHQLAERRIHAPQCLLRLIDAEQVAFVRDFLGQVGVQAGDGKVASAFDCEPTPGHIDDVSAHGLRCISEKAAVIRKHCVLTMLEIDVCLVQERGGAGCPLTRKYSVRPFEMIAALPSVASV